MTMNPPRRPTRREQIMRQLDRPMLTPRTGLAFGIGLVAGIIFRVVGG